MNNQEWTVQQALSQYFSPRFEVLSDVLDLAAMAVRRFEVSEAVPSGEEGESDPLPED